MGNVFQRRGFDEGDFTAWLAVVDEGGCDLGLLEVGGGVFGCDVYQEWGVFHNYEVCYYVFAIVTSGLL